MHAVNAADGSTALDLQDRRRSEVVADAGRRSRVDRLLRYSSLRAREPHRQGPLEAADRRSRARHTRRPRRRGLHHRLRRTASRAAAGDRRRALHDSPPAPTRARRRSSAETGRTSARSTTKCSAWICGPKKITWRYRNPNREFPFYSSAALVDGRVIVGGRDKSVHAIDAATGKAAWTFVTKARVDSSPAIAGGRVYIGSSDGRLYGLDAKTGEKQWEFDTGAGITSLSGDRGRAHRRRHAGRPRLLFRIGFGWTRFRAPVGRLSGRAHPTARGRSGSSPSHGSRSAAPASQRMTADHSGVVSAQQRNPRRPKRWTRDRVPHGARLADVIAHLLATTDGDFCVLTTRRLRKSVAHGRP